ncbi:MAG: hypothetical protein ACREVD_05100, partial [Burkholderiales bacterium]
MLTIGLLIDGSAVRLFDAELVRRLEADGIGRVALVIQQQLPARSFFGRVLRVLKRGKAARTVAFRAAVWIEKCITAMRRPEIKDLFRSVPIDQVSGAERLPVQPLVSSSGYVHRFAEQDLQAIRSRNLDLILRMGSGI